MIYTLGLLTGFGDGFTVCLLRWNHCTKRDDAFRNLHADRILELLKEK